MYTRKIHNLETGRIIARGFDLMPGDTIESLIADEILTFPSAWNEVSTVIRDDHHAVIKLRDGKNLVTRIAPDMDITIHISA